MRVCLTVDCVVAGARYSAGDVVDASEADAQVLLSQKQAAPQSSTTAQLAADEAQLEADEKKVARDRAELGS
ncbi:MAG: hypothetical protein WCA44_17910 [Acidobacteriaceae bacterium]